MELNANELRVQFAVPKAKHIVSHHSGSVLAKDEPLVPLSEEMKARVQSAYLAQMQKLQSGQLGDSSGPSGGAESQATAPVPVVEPVAQSSPSGFSENLAVKFLVQLVVDLKIAKKDSKKAKSLHDLVERMCRSHLTVTAEGPELSSSSSSSLESVLTEERVLGFIEKFYAPSYYFGQRLRRCASRGLVEDVTTLLLRGCSPNCADGEGLTALHYACEFNKPEVIKALRDKPLEAVSVNVRDKYGWTPLMTAAHHNTAKCCKLLLDMKADVSITEVNGETIIYC